MRGVGAPRGVGAGRGWWLGVRTAFLHVWPRPLTRHWSPWTAGWGVSPGDLAKRHAPLLPQQMPPCKTHSPRRGWSWTSG